MLEQYEPRLRDACRKIVADQQSFGRALFENIPKMMFIFLPLIAMAMAVLYLRSGRYYVEHLLFVVHFHAFFFLAGIAVLLLERLSALTGGSLATGFTAAERMLGGVLVFYVPWYLFRAMRRVYEQALVEDRAEVPAAGLRVSHQPGLHRRRAAVLHRPHAVRRCAGVSRRAPGSRSRSPS